MVENASPNVVCLSKHRVDQSSRLPEAGSGQDSDPSSETVAGEKVNITEIFFVCWIPSKAEFRALLSQDRRI